MPFVPLHVSSGYSFLKSGLTISKIAKSVKDNDYYGCGLCDFNVMHGVPEFIKAMEKIAKPYIVGMEIIIKDVHFCLYVKNEEGYKNLCYLSSIIDNEEEVSNYLANNHKGLIGILSSSEAYFKESIDLESRNTVELFKYLSNLVDDFYVGIDIANAEDRIYAAKLRDFADKYTYLTIAFPHILYQKNNDAITLEMVKSIDDESRKLDIKEKIDYQCFLSNSNYEKLYKKSELQLTLDIISSINFNFHHKRGEMLIYPVDDTIQYLKEQCYKRLKELNLEDEEHIKRLEKELDIIISMGYADYFLIVSDYVNYANSVGILTGPARGSAAASLVAYLLNITRIDPLKYDLLFERFLNPARKKMPDIDMDFMDTRREEVVTYLRNKYGHDKVANIVTYQTIAAKQSVRDVGRIYNYNERDINLICSRLIGRNYSLSDSYRKLAPFKSLIDSDKYYLEIISLASKIENLPRQTGLHAAGIVLNNSPMEKSMPIFKDFQGNYISQYSMDYLEEQGFLKMDLLGLRNLSIISDCVDLINKNHLDTQLDKFNIPYDIPEIYELISSGMTMGIFQLESSGMKNAISLLKPNCFNDIVALLALFRPGPMDNIPVYAKRKHGQEKVNYISDDLKSILSSTYGIIVYQEQIMQISQKMAGFTLEQADIFRAAVSKKDSEKMKQSKQEFIAGSLKNGYSEKTANEVYNLIFEFANYGFNKAHSVGYSVITCEMAYLKYKYPLEFYASTLSYVSSIDNSKFSDYISEMSKKGVEIVLPDVNYAENRFTIVNDKLMLPFTSIKGLPVLSAKAIIEERNKNGLYRDFKDFILRTFAYKISETNIMKLINSGSFDSLYHSRESLRESLIPYLQYAEVVMANEGQMSLDITIMPAPLLIEANDDPLSNLEAEYDSIGIMLSDNPLRYKKDLLKSKGVNPIADNINGNIFVAGIIKSCKTIMTKKEVPMAFVKIFDETGEMELTVFSDLYGKTINILKKNNIIVCKAHFNSHNGNNSYIADEIELLEE